MKTSFAITSPKTFNIALCILAAAALQLKYVYTYYFSGPAPSTDFDFGPAVLMAFGLLQAAIGIVGLVISLKLKRA